jgi:hypothetical protein
VRLSGFLGPTLEVGSAGGHTNTLIGGGGGLLINKAFFLGGYGMAMVTNNYRPVPELNDSLASLTFGHGGIWVGSAFWPKSVIHPILSLRAGWGGVSWRRQENDYWPNSFSNTSSGVFVMTPSLGIQINVMRYLRACIEFSRRYVSGLNLSHLNSNNLNGTSFSFSLFVGGF